jgi:serine/alanine racemase
MVLIIHIAPFQGELTAWQKYINFGLQKGLCRVAVPFYFIASGFFLFRKMPLDQLNPELVRDYCFKLLRMLGLWSVLLFVGKTVHLWYIGATVVAVTLVSLCLYHRIPLRRLYFLAGALYTIGLLGDAYYGIAEPLADITVFRFLFKGYDFAFSTTRNGVFMGFAYVLIGAMFAHGKIQADRKTALLGLILTLPCLIAEAFMLKSQRIPADYNMYLFAPPATICLFAFASGIQLKDRAIYRHLRKIGLLVYFTHLFVDKWVSLAISLAGKYFALELISFRFVLTLSGTLVLAAIIDWLSEKEKFSWLSWLIS